MYLLIKNFIKDNLELLPIFVILLIFLSQNYHFGDVNHIEQLPHILSKVDSHYLEQDFFVKYTREINPRFYYATFLGFALNFFSIDVLFYALTYISLLLTLSITYKITYLFINNRSVSMIVCIIMLFFGYANLGRAGMVIDSYLTPQLLSMPLILYAYYSSLKGKLLLPLISLCIALLIQPTFTLLATILVMVNIFYNYSLKRSIKYIGIYFGVLATITFYFFLIHQPTYISNQEYLYILAVFRHPHHYILSKFFFVDIIQFSILFILFLVSLFYLYTRKVFSNYIYPIIYSTVIILLLFIFAYFFTEIFSLKQVIQLQVYRLVFYIRWISVVVIVIAFFDLIKQRSGKEVANVFLIFLTCTLIINYSNDIPSSEDRTDLYKYIGYNTSKNALFLTPPDFGDMRIEPQRAIIVDWKSFPFNDQYMLEWYKRMIEVYGYTNNIDQQKEVYRIINDEKIEFLRNKYNINYAILYNNTDSKYPVLYNNEQYKIVQLSKE